MVGERSINIEAILKRVVELILVKMRGMSNDKGSENLPRRKPKDSRVKIVFPGLAGP